MTSALRRALSAVGWWDTLVAPGPSRILALNALVDAGGTGLAAVCLPFYALTVAGLDVRALALVLSVAGLCELVAAVPNGALAGRFGVRRFTVAAKLVQALGYLVLAVAHGLVLVLVLVALTGVARAGNSGLNQSLTVAVLGEGERAGTLGAVRALRNIGYLLSGAIGGLVLATGSTVALAVALAVNGLSFAFGMWCVLRLRPTARAEVPDRTDWSVLRDWGYLALILSAAVFGSSLVVLDVGLPLWVLRHHVIPRWTVAAAVVLNTAVVVVLQVRFASAISGIRQAVRSIRLSSLAFCGLAGLLALTTLVPGPLAVLLVLAGVAALTLGELLESPSWWTVSYELAPARRKDEYLAAFDLSWAVVAIAGPAAMAAVVSLDSLGWLLYGGVLLLAAGFGTTVVQRRAAAMPSHSEAPE
jgi:MFS family permease